VISDARVIEPHSSGFLFEVQFPSGKKMRVPSGFDTNELKELIHLLDSPC